MNLPPHLFSRMEYFMDNNKLSDLQDFIPQIDTMKNRMTKSSKWFETVGHRSAFWDPDFTTRQSQVCSDYINGASGIVSDGRLASERAVVLEGRPVAYSGELLPNLDAKSTVAPSNGESASYFFTTAMKRKTYEKRSSSTRNLKAFLLPQLRLETKQRKLSRNWVEEKTLRIPLTAYFAGKRSKDLSM
jgi:hypothetical protein